MQFVGYVRVDAYTISGNAPGSGLDDAAAIANLSSREPNQTVWVKVDGKTSFSFTPAQIGLKGKQAYLLTYYAQPKNIDGITQVVVSNRFEPVSYTHLPATSGNKNEIARKSCMQGFRAFLLS